MRENLRRSKTVRATTQHDIKLELDVRCQHVIEQALRAAFPQIAVLGEEGCQGDPQAEYRWVVDPIDGTVNFTYGIPHACVSIALQAQGRTPPVQRRNPAFTGRAAGPVDPPAFGAHASACELSPLPSSNSFQTLLGVVYDPFCDELWTAVRDRPARLNGRPIQVSTRRRLDEAIVAIGFAKEKLTLDKMLPTFNQLVHRVRKIRIMGAAALSLAYVATGRMDAYVEYGLRLWDIAAGGLIIECAGGEFWHQAVERGQAFRILANNGLLRRQLEKFA